VRPAVSSWLPDGCNPILPPPRPRDAAGEEGLERGSDREDASGENSSSGGAAPACGSSLEP
jgi:hypothetical protein